MRTVVPFLVVCGGIGVIASLAFLGCGATGSGSGSVPTAMPGMASESTAASILTVRPQSAHYSNGTLEDFHYFSFPPNVTALPTTPGTAVVVIGHKPGKPDTTNVSVRYAAEDPCVKDSRSTPILKSTKDTPDIVALYEVSGPTGASFCKDESYLDRAGQDGLTTCETTGDNGKRLDNRAIAIPGYVDRETGAYSKTCPDRKPCFMLACTTGVLAKCVHFGYPPWADNYETTGADGGLVKVDMAQYYQSCVHAARAHYCTGSSYTCEGTLIDIYDNVGIQKHLDDSTRSVESGWNENGLTCFNHPRFDSSWPVCGNTNSCASAKPDGWSVPCDTNPSQMLGKNGTKIGVRSVVLQDNSCVLFNEKTSCPESRPRLTSAAK